MGCWTLYTWDTFTFLEKAQTSINLSLFVFSEQLLVNTLENKSLQGVLIQGLIDPSFAYRYYSEGLDMMGIALANKCESS